MLNYRTLVLTVVLVLILTLGVSPALAARHLWEANPCERYGPSNTLGVEGGLLSLLNTGGSLNPDPIAQIIGSGAYSVHLVLNEQAAHITYIRSHC